MSIDNQNTFRVDAKKTDATLLIFSLYNQPKKVTRKVDGTSTI